MNAAWSKAVRTASLALLAGGALGLQAATYTYPGTWVVNANQATYLANVSPNTPANEANDNLRLQNIIDTWNGNVNPDLPNVLVNNVGQFTYEKDNASQNGDEIAGLTVVQNGANYTITLTGITPTYLLLAPGAQGGLQGFYFYIPQAAYVNNSYVLNFTTPMQNGWSHIAIWTGDSPNPPPPPPPPPPVPDGGATMVLLGMAMVGLEGLRRRMTARK